MGGYTIYNYKPCCPTSPTNQDGIKYIKTIGVSKPQSQMLLNLTSCYNTCKYIPPSAIQYGNKHDSYERVLRRRRGQALKNNIK